MSDTMTNTTQTRRRSPLHPDPLVLGEAWRELVVSEYEQVERLREWREQDYYAPIAHHFADDPHRTDDPVLNLLREVSRPDATWLDIGAGGGRYTLPLALVSTKVIAIEPSEGMRGVLQSGMDEHGIENIEIRPLRWPEGSDQVEADFSLISHVGYDIREINAFLDGAERATRERCVMVMMDRAPSGGFTRLWEEIHEEPRYQLPGFRELVMLLMARGATPEIRLTPRSFPPLDDEHIRRDARRRLWLSEGSEKDQRLQRLLDDLLPAGADDFQYPSVIAVVSWQPGRS